MNFPIHGFQKTTLLDYPGHVAATVFTGNCNFRCPFCQNMGLVLHPEKEPEYNIDDIMAFLKKRQGILDGVAVTGGEPTLHPGLKDFLIKVKELGYEVKLDTNGYRPDVLKDLVGSGLVDYVAMDIKSSPDAYSGVAGVDIDIEKINESVEFLIKGDLPFEFRTTVVRELHCAEDFRKIGEWIKGAPRYFLQCFKDSEMVLTRGLTAYSGEELLEFAEILKPYVGEVSLRGVD